MIKKKILVYLNTYKDEGLEQYIEKALSEKFDKAGRVYRLKYKDTMIQFEEK